MDLGPEKTTGVFVPISTEKVFISLTQAVRFICLACLHAETQVARFSASRWEDCNQQLLVRRPFCEKLSMREKTRMYINSIVPYFRECGEELPACIQSKLKNFEIEPAP